MLENFDKNVSIFTESLARALSRRKMMGTTVKGIFATVAAATLGQFTNVGDAFAVTCTCDEGWTTGSPCTSIGFPCPPHGCPSGCVTCYTGDCGGWCIYNTGKWVSCSGLGKCGKGYKVCRDCKCPDCNHKCTCLSATICRYCCTAQDVKAEVQRLAALGA